MKRSVFILIFVFVVSAIAMAESYVVYSVHGNVSELTKDGKAALAQRNTHLTDDSRIVIEKGASLTVYLNDARTLVSITEVGMQRLGTLVKRSRSKSQPSSEWVKALMSSLMKSDMPEYTHRQVLKSRGASYRDGEDPRELANAFAAYLIGKQIGSTTDSATLSVAFVDENGECRSWSNTREASPTSVVARVTNSGDKALFVNLVAVESDGSRSLVFPVDKDIATNCCAHLLVPPHSTIDLSELEFFPSDYETADRMVLVGAENQVNFTNLCATDAYDTSLPCARLFFAE